MLTRRILDSRVVDNQDPYNNWELLLSRREKLPDFYVRFAGNPTMSLLLSLAVVLWDS